MSYNNVVLVGNITHDLSIDERQSGDRLVQVCSFQLAVNYKTRTDFIQCVAFNKTATLIESYLVKGSKILVEGRLAVDEYNEKKYWSVKVSRVVFLDTPAERDRREFAAATSNEQFTKYDEKIPF